MFSFKRTKLGGILRLLILILMILLINSHLHADWATDSVATGYEPRAICVNPKYKKNHLD
jgi:hypothetical protein